MTTAPGAGPDAFDPETVLATLKDFQRLTVEYVFDRMYRNPGVDRFLVADEVGLGKTLVAKGVVAKFVNELQKKPGHRIDIVYLCANRDIARQNIARLNLFGKDRVSEASRLTLLPLHLKALQHGPNFVAFTPATALELGRATGVVRERALLYWLLVDVWELVGAAPKNVFQGRVGNAAWDLVVRRVGAEIDQLDNGQIDATIRKRFARELSRSRALRAELDVVLEHFRHRRDRPENVPEEARHLRDALIAKFRQCLAHACLSALEPDLIILDEFQRFGSLLDSASATDEDGTVDLGRQFLAYRGSKILLLSATPYKAYTLAHEAGTDNHHRDFRRVASFLLNDPERFATLERALSEFNEAIFDATVDGPRRMALAKQTMEAGLRRHMVRTERLGVTVDRDGMIEEVALPTCTLEAEDLHAFKGLDALARLMHQADMVEYWKSAPYILNFMERDGYAFKRELIAQRAVVINRDVAPAVRSAMLKRRSVDRFEPVPFQNARLRSLVSTVLDTGAWKLLWIPPSLPYYQAPGTPFAGPAVEGITKLLVFSSWKFVPRAIAGLVSYETERRIVGLAKAQVQGYEDLSSKRRRALLRFSTDDKGVPRDLNHLVPLYPSLSLCEIVDPLEEARSAQARSLPLDHHALVALVARRIRSRVLCAPAAGSARDDQRWYSVAMPAADLRTHGAAVNAWFAQEKSWARFLDRETAGDRSEQAFGMHVEHLTQLAGSAALGKMPDDLAVVLAKAALGSPAIVALRSFRRVCQAAGVEGFPTWLLDAAARVGLAFRSLFNQPDATVLTRALYGGGEERYWEAMLDHCIAGNLQAVMDEHVHILRESLGVGAMSAEKVVARIVEEIEVATGLRATVLRADDIRVGSSVGLSERPISLRCRSALRFDTDIGEDGKDETRADHVRVAFNSPFRPFVLASTAVGQEGLDFHLWCHAIFHWNLPSNPVDFEQREGRVHRYKGHVVRRSLASAMGLASLEGMGCGEDPWEWLFSAARAQRPAGANDLVPYWVFNGDGRFKIRRYIPALPLSRERDASRQLRAALGAYRVVFGQPRQEDLLAFLQTSDARHDLDPEKYALDLAPRMPPPPSLKVIVASHANPVDGIEKE
jgi:hypothetical protein